MGEIRNKMCDRTHILLRLETDSKGRDMSKYQHSANFLVSSFLCNKRSLNPVYKLNPTRIAILRYICDSMDIGKKKNLRTKLYQSQISKYCHIDIKNLRPHLKMLIKKKFINYDSKTHFYKLGKVLTIWGDSPYGKDIGQNVLSDRYRTNHPTSNVSNITNKILSFEKYKPAETAYQASELLEEWQSKKGY